MLSVSPVVVVRAPNTVERVHVSRLYGTEGVGKSRETTQRDRARLLVRGWRERARERREREREGSGSECSEGGERKKRDCPGGGGGRNGRDRAPWKEEEERASGQGMLVGSLMRLAMHAPYGSDQISDRLPSPPVPLSLPFPFPSPPPPPTERQSGPRLDR